MPGRRNSSTSKGRRGSSVGKNHFDKASKEANEKQV